MAEKPPAAYRKMTFALTLQLGLGTNAGTKLEIPPIRRPPTEPRSGRPMTATRPLISPPANAFDIVQQSDFTTNELAKPNGHRIGLRAGAADVEERLDRQHRIDRHAADPSLLPRLLEMFREVGALKAAA
jgi:hypothetical protein